ncbi:MAG: hypothetical protein DMG01_08070 [Acidobacteria bacterium]|nr:MAG: hypothetical protein DMG01_08070 [Acidobacteriota bacterium]
MSRKKKILIGVAIVLIGGAVVGANLYFKKDKGLPVTTEAIRSRDLEAVVSASGKIQPKRLVQISADTPGRVVNLAVNEGDRVKVGQFLLQIDPKSLRTRVDSNAASLQAAEQSLDQMRQSIETAKVQLQQAQQNLARQQDLWRQQLTTREALDKVVNDVRAAESNVQEREKQIKPQESRIAQERAVLESARYDLSKVRIESPIDGIVTRRNIQEGETAVVGTMNNAGTVLLTLADMAVIQAEVEVDETNVPNVQIRQIAKITIDAIPDRSFKGHVTEIGNSPIHSVDDNGPGGRRHTGHELQGGRGVGRAGAGSSSGLHLHRRHYDRDAQERGVGADSGGRRPRAGVRRERPGRPAAADRQEAPSDGGAGGVGRGAEAGPDAETTQRSGSDRRGWAGRAGWADLRGDVLFWIRPSAAPAAKRAGVGPREPKEMPRGRQPRGWRPAEVINEQVLGICAHRS